MIEITTLGTVATRRPVTGEPLDLAHQPKCLSLLVYLAVAEAPVRRDRILSLLWPELGEARARAALRQLLFRIRQGVGEVVERDGSQALRLAPSVGCDAVELRHRLREGRWEAALGLYRGDFLAGFYVPDARQLEDWIEEVRARLRQEVAEAAWELTRSAQARGDLAGARRWGKWALARSPYDDQRVRDYLALLREAGEMVEAAAVYQEFARRLEDDLGARPSPATRRIVEHVIGAERGELIAFPREPEWSRVRVRSRAFSQNTVEAIRRTSGIRWEHHVSRPFFRNYLERFLETSCAATALVAPAGYGKTVGLAQALESLWLGADAPESEDVVWFVQMRDLSGLAARGVDLPAWLLAQMGLGGGVDYRGWFRGHPEQRAGRIVLVLDGLDEHSLSVDLLDGLFAQLVSLIGSIREPWFRVVLSLRTAAWQRFTAHVPDAPAFWDLWYGVGSDGLMEEPDNVPLLRPDEVERVVRCAWALDGQPLGFPHRALLDNGDILSQPFYLQLFLQSTPRPVAPDRLAIVERFLERRVHSPPRDEEKAALLDALLQATMYGMRQRVPRETLLSMGAPELESAPQNRQSAYRALISAGILVEEVEEEVAGGATTLVRVGQPALLEILVARHWMREAGGVTGPLLEEVASRYRGNMLRLPVLAWLVRYALRTSAYDALTAVFHLPVAESELRHLGRVLGYGLRESEAARQTLMPRWARDPASRAGYFESFVDQDYLVPQFMESLEPYLRNARNRQERIFARSLLLLGSLMRLDPERAHQEAERLTALGPDGRIHPLPLGRALGYLLVYHQHFGDGIPGDLLDRLFHFVDTPPRRDDVFGGFPTYHLHAMEALNLCGRFHDSLRVMERALSQYPRLALYRNRTTFHDMIRAHHAMALLQTGDLTAAHPILDELDRDPGLRDPHSYPTYHYARLHALRARAEYRARAGDPGGGAEDLGVVIDTSRRRSWRFFEVRAVERRKALLYSIA